MLPLLQIPWLDWSFFTFLAVWLLHVGLDFWLMYNLSLPYAAIFLSISKLFYDRELSLSDTRVNPGYLVDPSEIILGRQIINLLPEGSAILNPALQAYCIDETTRTIELPIQINQTAPVSTTVYLPPSVCGGTSTKRSSVSECAANFLRLPACTSA